MMINARFSPMTCCFQRALQWKRTHFTSISKGRGLPGSLLWSGHQHHCFSTSRHAMVRELNRGSRPRTRTSDNKRLWLLIIPVTTFCLGTWQIYRLKWKLDLIELLEKKTRKPPVDITPDIFDHLGDMEYSRVLLTGYFDHSRELYVSPRTINAEGSTGTQHRNVEPGACVVTPFFSRELAQWVLINRGWVPNRKIEPSTRLAGQVEGDISLTAVVRTDEKRSRFTPENDPAQNRWLYRDVQKMAEHADTAPLFLDADATTSVEDGPIGGQTRVKLRNDHLQYIFTWYCLSLVTAYMFYNLWTKYKNK